MGWRAEAAIEVDARLDLISDLITGAKRGEFSPLAAADAIDRLAPALTRHVRALNPTSGSLPQSLAHEVELLTRS